MKDTGGMGGMPGMGSGGGHMAGMSGMGSQSTSTHNILTAWASGAFPFAVAVVLVAIALWYLRAARLRSGRARDHATNHPDRPVTLRTWSRWRTLSFLVGLVTVELALGSSIATLSATHFPAHMIQHLILMMVAPPLLALGAPMTLLLQSSSRAVKRRVLAGLHSTVFALISHPIPVFFLYYGSMFAFFLTPALGYAMDHMALMDLINVGFFLGGTLYWWPMVGIDPIPRWAMTPGIKVLNLLIGIPFESFLAIALLMAADPAASMYSVASTHDGAGVLWSLAELLTAIALLPIFMQWTRADARLARRIDARIDAGESMAPRPMEGHGLAATMKSLRRG